MQSYGKFQAVRELYQTPLGSVWSALPVGEEGPPSACIKLIQPESAVFEGGGVAAAKEMLVSAAIQQSIANKAENWAPVYELGYDGQTAFFVSRLYDRSLQRLVASKAKLTSGDLLTISSAIVEGLASLRAAHDRPHGNLKPSNVLISGKGRIRQEAVVLADPYPGDPEVPSVTRSPDAKALGEILFSLVTGRPYMSARWPVQRSAEWDRLGSSGGDWLALCNDLLNTMARGGPPSLEDIASRLSIMRRGPRRIPRAWFAVAASVCLIAGGYLYRQDVKRIYAQVSDQIVKKFPATSATTRQSEPLLIAPAVVPDTAVVPRILPAPAQETSLVAPEVKNVPVAEITPPAFLSAGAASKFSRIMADPTRSTRPTDRANFKQTVASLEQQYPRPALGGEENWQIKLQAMAEAKWDTELTQAVSALADSKNPDPATYLAFLDSVERYNREAVASESAIKSGATWKTENLPTVQLAIADRINLFDDSAEGIQSTPVDLEQLRGIAKSQDAQTLTGVIHDTSRSLPVRIAAWQRLCDPRLNESWPRARKDFVAGQVDGQMLIKLADASPPLKQAVDEAMDLRVQQFYSTVNTQPVLTDAIEHVAEIEAQHADHRPGWFDYDCVLYKLKNEGASSIDELRRFQPMSALPEYQQLQAAMMKVAAISASDQPLSAVGPCLLKDWVVRVDRSGCTYTCENFPSVEFIRVQPSGKPGCTEAFYLSTTNVTIELISALLETPGAATTRANIAIRHLNLADAGRLAAGAKPWRFKEVTGIELDPDGYSRCFAQATADVKFPIQQITPRAAVFLARYLGCRLPTSAEWQAAWAFASTHPDQRIRRFATSAWKLRDADFAALTAKSIENNSCFPDEGAFLGSDPSQILTGARARTWQPAKLAAMGGWSLAERSTDAGKTRIAELGTISDDLDADLLEPPDRGFRPVGNAQGVFHDLVGNVAEYVLDASTMAADQLPAAEALQEKDIADWFNAAPRLQQFGVIGGSFLSPPELDPRLRQNLPALTDPMFADVGVRLAFTDPKEFIDPAMVVKNASYAYPHKPGAVRSP